MIFNMLVTAFLCLLSSINAYHNGAPAQVCQTMLPSHGAEPQTSSRPYSISVEPMSYSSGTTVTVTLRSVIGTPFKGYLLQIRRIDNQAIVAGFSVPNGGKLLTCDNQNNAAVTHTENSNKISVSFIWTAPTQSVGTLRVVATVVQDKPTFWTMIQSVAISAAPPSTPAGGGQQTTTAGAGQGSTPAGGGQQTTTASAGQGSTPAGGGQQTTTAGAGQGSTPRSSAAFTMSSFLRIFGAVAIAVLIL